ncbi:SCO3374 family protein [Streptomyces sp. NPDC001941]|uniref:SCO3374 family protein n=1 Tax=Streptomyces sp. NPDC001941 TaxID=3154659 RepID=UPI00331FA4BD
MALTVPLPREPFDDGRARWYENALGWATSDGPPVQLVTGLRFDVLELPAAAGQAVLKRFPRTGPVALMGRRVRMLVAAGSAEELPGLLDWLEWGGVALDLSALGTGGRMAAPVPPGQGTRDARGTAVWLRPPEPGHEVEPTLPALDGLARGTGHGPGLVRLVEAAAAECHRLRLRSAAERAADGRGQPLAFS